MEQFCRGATSVVLGQVAYRPCPVQKLQFPHRPYSSNCWMVQRLTCRRMASSNLLTPCDRSPRMCSLYCSVRVGRCPGKRPSVRALAWPATERSLMEFRHHSLKASTTASCSLPVDVDVSKSSDRNRDFTSARCSRQVSTVSGGDKGDRVGGRSLTAIVWLLNPVKPAPAVTPAQGGFWTICSSAPERSAWINRPC